MSKGVRTSSQHGAPSLLPEKCLYGTPLAVENDKQAEPPHRIATFRPLIPTTAVILRDLPISPARAFRQDVATIPADVIPSDSARSRDTSR